MAGRKEVAGNGRVTLALLGQKLDSIEILLREQCKLQAMDHDRIAVLEGEDRRLSERIERMGDRLNAFQIGQAILTAIASSIAGWLGSRR